MEARVKLTLRFQTNIGPRVGVLEVSDEAAAIAILNAHLAGGSEGALCPEMPRLSMKDHIAQHKRKQKRARSKAVPAPNVLPLRKQRT